MSGHRPVPAIPQQPQSQPQQQTTNISKPLPSVPSSSSSFSPKTPASGAVVVSDAAAVRHFVQKTRSASGERRLYVTVATGKALPSKSLTGSPSAYCKLGIISSSTNYPSSNSSPNGTSSGGVLPSDCQRTKVCRGTATIWHQQFVFPIKGYGTTSDLTLVDSGGGGGTTGGDKFILECYHSHRGVYSTFIGFIEISVSSIVNELEEKILRKDMREFDAGEEYLKGNRLTKWYPLRKQLPKKKSSLTSFLGGSGGGSGSKWPSLSLLFLCFLLLLLLYLSFSYLVLFFLLFSSALLPSSITSPCLILSFRLLSTTPTR
jgi:hypothetical protein